MTATFWPASPPISRASLLWRDLIDGLSPDNDPAFAVPADWAGWIAALAPGYLWPPYAAYHAEFWAWVWAIEQDQSARPFVAVWPRGFAKSSSVEVAVAAMAARQTRRYALYVCATQDQADGHVANVAKILESPAFARAYPDAAARSVGKYGASDGWRRNRLRTRSGFTVDAIGLDTAARGIKVSTELGTYRPDLIVCDDVDELFDAPGAVAKKETSITKSLLPARASHAAVLVAQNLIHADGIVARLADGRADYLADRIMSGPHPAIAGLVTEQRDGRAAIVAGESTWPAKTIADLQAEMNELGESAFRSEKQHEVDRFEGGIFGHVVFRHCRWDELPPLDRIVVWVDPAVTDRDESDSHGIQADGLARDGDIYRLWSWEQRTSPEDALRQAILKAVELGAECVGVETDQGGDTWESVYDRAWDALVARGALPERARKPAFRQAKAGAIGPKAQRAGQMLVDYEHGQIVHVIGTHETLEQALRRYLKRKPYDLVDSAFWSWHDLRESCPPPMIAAPAMTRASTWRSSR